MFFVSVVLLLWMHLCCDSCSAGKAFPLLCHTQVIQGGLTDLLFRLGGLLDDYWLDLRRSRRWCFIVTIDLPVLMCRIRWSSNVEAFLILARSLLTHCVTTVLIFIRRDFYYLVVNSRPIF